MIIETNPEGKALVMKIVGRMDADSNKKFDEACAHCFEQGSVHLVVDVSELKYINSAGLGSFLRNAKRAQEKGGALLLCGLHGLVKEVFEMTRLISVFAVFDSVAAACQSIS